MDYQKTISQLYQDFNDRDVDSVLAQVHTHVTWPNGWEGGYVHGHVEVRDTGSVNGRKSIQK